MHPPLRCLPLAVLYLSERCNSRCVTCDYWRHGRADMSLAAVESLLESFERLGTRQILISGGEPLLNREWIEISQLLRSRGMKLLLLTSGLSLAKHAAQACELFESITVSLDGTDAETYAAIRGVDAFDNVCEGIRAVARRGGDVSIRVTVQRSNYAQLPRFVALARELSATSISFLAADVGNPHAFGRNVPGGFAGDISLQADELPRFEKVLESMARECAQDFESGLIAESPRKLRRILDYYAAICGRGEFPAVRCNAPEFSAVIEAGGRLRPCFFIPGPEGALAHAGMEAALNGSPMATLREEIRLGRRPECSRCVCSMWRELA